MEEYSALYNYSDGPEELLKKKKKTKRRKIVTIAVVFYA